MRKTSCYPFATPPTLATPPILSEDVTFGKIRLSTDSKGCLTGSTAIRLSTDSKRHTDSKTQTLY